MSAWPPDCNRTGAARQRFNVCSHLAGLPLTAAWMYALLAAAPGQADLPSRLGVAVFGVAAAALYAASVACHSARGETGVLWQRVDHIATFFLIAGSYTPFALAAPRHPANLLVLAIVWAIAVAESIRHLRRGDAAAPPLKGYVTLGWLSVVGAAPVAFDAGYAAAACLLGGGFLYSAGTLFYRNRSGWKHAHGVWHLFVLAGTASHYACVGFVLGVV